MDKGKCFIVVTILEIVLRAVKFGFSEQTRATLQFLLLCNLACVSVESCVNMTCGLEPLTPGSFRRSVVITAVSVPFLGLVFTEFEQTQVQGSYCYAVFFFISVFCMLSEKIIPGLALVSSWHQFLLES